MNATSSLPAIAALLAAFVTAITLCKFIKAPENNVRLASIDGLRGYLAFFVFLHHSCIWYFYLHGSIWKIPPSNLYTNFGESSVALFFMITGFLFFSKISEKGKQIDWVHIYTSRILRLTPLYIVAISLVLLIVGTLSAWNISESTTTILKNTLKWILFTIPGNPDLNGIKDTRYIMAGVAWSLVYEWFFYLSLPILALLIRIKSPFNYIGLVLICIYFSLSQKYFYLSFFGGIAASIFSKSPITIKFSKSRLASLIIISCLALTVFLFSTSFTELSIILLSIAFIFIANGNSLFGLLTNKSSHILGDMAYSIYLLHGIILFVCFKFIIGFEQASKMTPIQHWTVVLLITPILITLCFFSATYIEKPPMRFVREISNWISSKFVSIAYQFRLR